MCREKAVDRALFFVNDAQIMQMQAPKKADLTKLVKHFIETYEKQNRFWGIIGAIKDLEQMMPGYAKVSLDEK